MRNVLYVCTLRSILVGNSFIVKSRICLAGELSQNVASTLCYVAAV
jgi:hypothetical protein